MSGFKLTHEGLLAPDAGQFQAGAEGLFADLPGNVRHHMVGRQFYQIAADRSLSTASGLVYSNMLGKNPSLRAGVTYEIAYDLLLNLINGAQIIGNANVQFVGTAAFSYFLGSLESFSGGTSKAILVSSTAAIDWAPLSFAASTSYLNLRLRIKLNVRTSSAGTLIIQSGQNNSPTSFTLKAGSSVTVTPISTDAGDVEIGSWA